MRRSWTLGVVWLAIVVVCAEVTWIAISSAGRGVGGESLTVPVLPSESATPPTPQDSGASRSAKRSGSGREREEQPRRAPRQRREEVLTGAATGAPAVAASPTAPRSAPSARAASTAQRPQQDGRRTDRQRDRARAPRRTTSGAAASPAAPAPTTSPTPDSGSESEPRRDDDDRGTTAAPATRDQWRGEAGEVTVSCRRGRLSLISATPQDGWRVEVEGTRVVTAEFHSLDRRRRTVEVTARCGDRGPWFTTETSSQRRAALGWHDDRSDRGRRHGHTRWDEDHRAAVREDGSARPTDTEASDEPSERAPGDEDAALTP